MTNFEPQYPQGAQPPQPPPYQHPLYQQQYGYQPGYGPPPREDFSDFPTPT